MLSSVTISGGSLQSYSQKLNIICQVYARICEHRAGHDTFSTIYSQRREHTRTCHYSMEGYLESFIIMNILSSSAQC